MTVPCTHGMPTPASCVTCMADGNLEPPAPKRELRAESAPFSARYPDHCAGCNLEIHEGVLVVRMTDGTYRHARCGEGR